MIERPDVLVLGVGGTLGEAWMRGVLCGIEAAGGLDFRECGHFVGSSAGSIVAASLAAGRSPRAGDRAARGWSEPSDRAARAWGEAAPDPGSVPGLLGRAAGVAGRTGIAAAGPLAPAALAGLAPVRGAVRAAALSAVPRGTRSVGGLRRHLDRLGARFDGRLRVAAVDRRTGRRVVFGSSGAPTASVTDAVLASCAVPGLFEPVEIGGREYVDGGVWSPTNLDAAPAGRGARVLCLVPTALAGGLAPLRAFSRAALAAESAIVRGRGARVETILPDASSAAVMGVNLMDPSRSEEVLDAAFAQGCALAR